MKSTALAFVAGILLSALLSFPESACGQVVEAWAQRYSNAVDSKDQAQKAVTDGSGNVIVAGYTDQGISGPDMLVVKYSGGGVALWTNRYDGPANGDDEAVAVAVDGSGNVFVTGYSPRNGSGIDWITIAYSATGVPLWTNRYDGPASNFDKPFAVATDTNGNVFVTGYGATSGNTADYATIKYSGAGVALWTNRFNAAGNNANEAHAMTVSSSGTVIVTGVTGNGTALDVATIAYSGAGVALWTNRFNGPANGDDRGNAVAVDTNGNVFVTGISVGSGSSYDYVTIKYSGAGVPLWTNRYNGPANGDDQAIAMAVGTNGNLFVSGFSVGVGSSYDYATIAYSGAGVALWTNRYNGPGLFEDRANALTVDGSGNVLVTGFSYGSSYDYATIKYSGAGVALWTNRYNGPVNGDDRANAVAVDGIGNVFVTGFSPGSGGSSDWATLKYSDVGAPLWTSRYNGAANYDDQPQAMAADSSGNVFVTGFSYNSAGSSDWATVAYSSAGVPLWTNRFNGPGTGNAQANAVVADINGNVFVAGYSTGSGGNPDFVTIKYSGAGVSLWTNRYNGSGNNSDFCNAMAIDGNGNVIVTGTSIGTGGNYDWATVAYSNGGVPQWTNRYNGPGNSTDDSKAVAVDGNGNVFVTGYSTGSGTSSDYTTVAYSSVGVPMWTNRYDGISFEDNATAVAVDGDGNVIVTGSSLAFNSSTDFITIKYSNGGIPLWTNRYNGVASSGDAGLAVVVDGSRNVFVTGYSVRVGSSSDYTTIKYSGAGVALWTNYYNGPGSSSDEGRAVAVDSGGNVIVTGYSRDTNSIPDYATIKYSGEGEALWTNRYNGPANNDDSPTTKSCLAIGTDGSVFVTGASRAYATGTSRDYATVKYATATMLPVLLNIQKAGNQAVVTWIAVGFGLQSAPLVTGLFTNVTGANSPYTNPITGSQMYFRLKAN